MRLISGKKPGKCVLILLLLSLESIDIGSTVVDTKTFSWYQLYFRGFHEIIFFM